MRGQASRHYITYKSCLTIKISYQFTAPRIIFVIGCVSCNNDSLTSGKILPWGWSSTPRQTLSTHVTNNLYKMTTSGEMRQRRPCLQAATVARAAPGLQVSSSSRSLRLRRATRTGWHGSGARSTAQTGRGPALSHPPPNPPMTRSAPRPSVQAATAAGVCAACAAPCDSAACNQNLRVNCVPEHISS